MTERPAYRLITTARAYGDVNRSTADAPDPFADAGLAYSDIGRFQVIAPIGSGRYSHVFLGRADGDRDCAIKTLKNIAVPKIQRECAILRLVADIPNVIRLLAVVKDPTTEAVSIVTEYHKADPPRELFPRLDLGAIRVLMWQLLNCLDGCARCGVMHRDVKPGNLLISQVEQSLSLIDWGLADLYYPQRAYSVRVSTMRYKAPELLLNYQYYDYGVDVWGSGCVMAEMLIKFPFFEGSDIEGMIAQIARVSGTMALMQYVDKYGLVLPRGALSQFPSNPGPGWERVTQNMQGWKYDDEAIDLLKKLLTIDHAERLTASEALEHPFFNEIREEMRSFK
jgi:casein kinase II subunit alpha